MISAQGLLCLAVVLVIVCVSSRASEAAAEQKQTILFINDLRYDLFPVDAASTEDEKPVCVTDDKAEVNCVGGLSRLMKLLQDSMVTEDTLWLNAGNFLGGPNYDILKFQTAAKASNILKFNASALGPELFQYGLYPTGAYFEAMDNPTVLASNWQQHDVVTNSTLIPLSEGCHAAVIGFINKERIDEMNVFGVSIEDEKSSIEREVAAIKSANADKKILYIALGSASIDKAKALSSIQDIDLLIFSGGNFSATGSDEHAYLQPVNVSTTNKTNWIASVNRNFNGVDSRFLIGQLSFVLTEECQIADKPEMSLLEYLKSEKDPDEELQDFLHTEAGNVAAVKDVVAVTKVRLLPTPDACVTGECSLGGLIADAMVGKLNAMNEALPWAESVKLAVFPGGIIRNVENATGLLTSQTFYNCFDYDEFIYTISLTGAQLKTLFEISIKEFKTTTTTMTDLLQVSDSLLLQFEDKKVVSLQSVSESSDSLELTPVDLTDTKTVYKVAVPSSLVYHSESYKFLRDVGQPELSNVTVVDALRTMVGRGLPNNYLPLPATGGRLLRVKKPSEPDDCVNTTGEAVILTLVVVGALAASGIVLWKIVLPKYRTRRGSATHLLP